jgi:hypothetical protein
MKDYTKKELEKMYKDDKKKITKIFSSFSNGSTSTTTSGGFSYYWVKPVSNLFEIVTEIDYDYYVDSIKKTIENLNLDYYFMAILDCIKD